MRPLSRWREAGARGRMRGMNECKRCGEILSKKQYGRSLQYIGRSKPWHWKHPGGEIIWAMQYGPLCPKCLTDWDLESQGLKKRTEPTDAPADA